MKKESKRERLLSLYRKMKKDEKLPLRNGANKLVFGEGDPEAEVVLIGEGPGYWEDQKGRPFVGRAGAFLNQLLHLIELPREKVFITNVVNYRPPENRDPTPEEIAAFKPYIDKIIEIIKPKIIITLGRFSMAKFLPGVKISQVHGKPTTVNWHGREILIIPMYHPAAGLRNGEVKRKTTEDFKIIPGILKELKEKNKTKVEQMPLV